MNNNIIVEDEITCPFGDEEENLKGRKLTAEEKSWLARMILTQEASVEYLCERYKLASRRLWEYAYRTQIGIVFHETGGRPKALDAISHEICYTRAQQEPRLSNAELRDFLRTEHKNTLCRRWPKLNRDDPILNKDMARRTLMKYISLYRTHERKADNNGQNGIVNFKYTSYSSLLSMMNIICRCCWW
jgi:hypothetical protein